MTNYDSLILISFGGPEGPDDVMPFLENVTRGRAIPRERLAVVGAHYDLFGGTSPINQQNRDLLDALSEPLRRSGIELPLYWGNRNWHPLLADTAREMASAGHRRALGIVTSAFGSRSGCHQYSEDIAGATKGLDLTIDKVRPYWNHPGFLNAMADRLDHALDQLGDSAPRARLVFTAHSIPEQWCESTPYVDQLTTAAQYLAANSRVSGPWDLVFQSRSGGPDSKWLEPDINDHLKELPEAGVDTVVLVPLGFVSDHMEVIYDLDVEARATADAVGLHMVRAETVGIHPDFVEAVVQLVLEGTDAAPALAAVDEPWPTPCPPGCCRVPDRVAPSQP